MARKDRRKVKIKSVTMFHTDGDAVNREGTVAHYLTHQYPFGMDYEPIRRGDPLAIHEKTLDDEGIPAIKESFLRSFDRIPRQEFYVAIAQLKGVSEEGKRLVDILEFYQNQRLNKISGLSVEQYGARIGCSSSSVRRLYYKAISILSELVFRQTQRGMNA